MLDHGMLNLPLAKRMGNIDAQIDAYKAKQIAERKAAARVKAKEMKALRIQAGAVLAAMPADQLARIAAKGGVTAIQARAKLQSLAYWEPARVIAIKAPATAT